MVLKKQLMWIALAITVIMGLGNSIFAPSMPSIAADFVTSSGGIQFSYVTYFSCYLLGLITIDPISDHFNRRKSLLFGLLLYLAFTLLIALSTSLEMFWIARGVQGFAGSILAVSFRATLRDRFSGHNLSKALNYSSLGYLIGPAIGPVIGGFLQELYGWRAPFYALTIIALVVILFVFFKLVETHKKTIPITFFHTLARYESVWKKRSLVGASICRGIQYGMLLIFVIHNPFFLINILRFSPIFSGHVASVITIVTILGISLNRLLIKKIDEMILIRMGIAITLVIVCFQVWFAWLYPKNLWSFVDPIALILFFGGLISTNMSNYAFNFISNGEGIAAALQDFLTVLAALVVIGCSILLPSAKLFPFSLYFAGLVIFVFAVYKWIFLKGELQR